MRYAEIPADVWPLLPNKDTVRGIRLVTSLDIYDGISNDFHPDGLYSIETFGRIGTPERNTRPSYINLRCSIIHPKIFREFMSMRAIYKGIVSGKILAKFDPVLKDFVPDTSETADTGYSFFVKHMNNIVFKPTKSPTRLDSIKLIENYRSKSLVDYIPVIPAGLRELEIDESTGRTTKNEIHDLYFRALSISNTIPTTSDYESPALDITRNSMTNTALAIYEMVEGMMEGKNGFVLNKWASRRVAHGTRNVLSVMDTSINDLSSANAPGFNAAVVGLYQTIKGLTPVTIHHLKKTYGHIFSTEEGQTRLVNRKTLRSEWVTLLPETRDIWSTREGLESVMDQLKIVEARHRPVIIQKDYYLGLVYLGPDNTFRVFYDIAELPDHLDKKHVKPLSLIEMIYLSGYSQWNKYFTQVVRYPITGVDSSYSAQVYVKTTTIGDMRRELDSTWEPMAGDQYVALEYPRHEMNTFIDTLSPHSGMLTPLGADFDGDTGSATYVMSRQALEENARLHKSRTTWVKPDGRLKASFNYDTINYVVANLTGRFQHGTSDSVRPVVAPTWG